MAYVAGAGSIVTLLGAARGAVAIGFFHDITGEADSFFELSYYMFPLGWLMTFLLWLFFMLFSVLKFCLMPSGVAASRLCPHNKHEVKQIAKKLLWHGGWGC